MLRNSLFHIFGIRNYRNRNFSFWPLGGVRLKNIVPGFLNIVHCVRTQSFKKIYQLHKKLGFSRWAIIKPTHQSHIHIMCGLTRSGFQENRCFPSKWIPWRSGPDLNFSTGLQRQSKQQYFPKVIEVPTLNLLALTFPRIRYINIHFRSLGHPGSLHGQLTAHFGICSRNLYKISL